MEQEIRELEAKQARAILAPDLTSLDQIWWSGFIVNAPDNTVKLKEQVLREVRESRISYASFQRTVERVVIRGDTVVSMGSEVVVPKGDQPDAGTQQVRRYTHVWQRVDGAWIIIARHANVVRAAPE